MDIKALEAAILRDQLVLLAITAISVIITIVISYLVLRAAIRDGIRESGLVQAMSRVAGTTPPLRDTTNLPEMRADR
ncbi:hypothetical protein [Ramlibacter sp.]|uniref:hypothetical protein n=1 Tax=Ramlibacter sp. TaxID=1917967 RepID=UPI00184C1465|nr:hypothetical protein [Ramlibacter sp.]MBA2676138.1 hypothetical protein [Ramlibacter sp.]